MKYKYIAIEREYGSGGTQIAREAAERCKMGVSGCVDVLEMIIKHMPYSCPG